jgi:hypothetical protein
MYIIVQMYIQKLPISNVVQLYFQNLLTRVVLRRPCIQVMYTSYNMWFKICQAIFHQANAMDNDLWCNVIHALSDM